MKRKHNLMISFSILATFFSEPGLRLFIIQFLLSIRLDLSASFIRHLQNVRKKKGIF